MEFMKKELKKMELGIFKGTNCLFNKIERESKEIELEIDEGADRLSNKIERGLKKVETEKNEGADRLSNKNERKARKMKTKMVEKMEYLTKHTIQGMQMKRVDRRNLQPGDHIFVNRIRGSYSHHGICIEGGLVIHFTKPKSKQEIMSPKLPCRKCGYQENRNQRIVKSCLDCFLKKDTFLTGHSLYLYLYGVPTIWFLIKKRGTCSKLPSNSPEEVVEKAEGLFKKSDGFGKYDLLSNNCESFATFCKTGNKQSSQADTIKFYITVAVSVSGHGRYDAVGPLGRLMMMGLEKIIIPMVLELLKIRWIDAKRNLQVSMGMGRGFA